MRRAAAANGGRASPTPPAPRARRYTHYFYRVLKADYTFPAHRLNDVPVSLYFMTHAYFMVRALLPSLRSLAPR